MYYNLLLQAAQREGGFAARETRAKRECLLHPYIKPPFRGAPLVMS
jgi:hypothetical protein